MSKEKKKLRIFPVIGSVLVIAAIAVGILLTKDTWIHLLHSKSEWKVITDATCTENGENQKLCECGKVYTALIPATGHTMTEWIATVEPSCTTEGKRDRHCAVCKLEETEALSILSHDYSAIKNTWVEEANRIESVCSMCGVSGGDSFEGGYSEETNTVYLYNCQPDFSFEVEFAGEEEQLRANLGIVESMFSTTTGELLDAFKDEYSVAKVKDNTWKITPVNSYIKRTVYDVLLGEGVSVSAFPGKNLSFRIAGESSDVAVFNDDIIFLKSLETEMPGYYPYTSEFDSENSVVRVTVSQEGIFTQDMLGKILCVGDCTDMETAVTLPSEEMDIGRIQEIKALEDGKYLITLGAVGMEDIYSELDVTLGDKTPIIVEEMSVEDKEQYVQALLSSDAILNASANAKLAADGYAAKLGMKAGNIDWDDFAQGLYEAIEILPVINKDDKVSFKIGIVDFDYSIPIEYKEGVEIASVSLKLTLICTVELGIDGSVSKTNLTEYIDEKLDIFHDDTLHLEFLAKLDTCTEVTFIFDIALKASVSNEVTYYVVTPSTKTIHTDFCRYAGKYAYDDANCYTLGELKSKFGDDYQKKQCKECTPFDEENFFIINKNNAEVHCGNCPHLPAEANQQISYVLPTEGASYGKNKSFSYCGHCTPGEHSSKSFDEYFKAATGDSDWGKQMQNLKDKFVEEVKLTVAPEKGKQITVNVWFLAFQIDIKPVVSFELEATVSFRYKSISRRSYTAELNYNDEVGYFFTADSEDTLTAEDKKAQEAILDITGKITASTGVRFTFAIGPAAVTDWFNLNLQPEIGVYARLSGMVHINFNNSDENFAGGCVELGIYAHIDFSYVIFGYSPEKNFAILPRKEWPLVKFGNDNVYYGYEEYDVVIDLGQKNIYAISDSLPKAYYYNLESFERGLGQLSYKTGGVENEYKIEYSFVDPNGKKINYCSVKNGVLYVDSSSPTSFEAFMKITVTDLDKFTVSDILKTGKDGEFDTAYSLPEITVKIIYDIGDAAQVESVSVQKGAEYKGGYDSKNNVYVAGQPLTFTVTIGVNGDKGVGLYVGDELVQKLFTASKVGEGYKYVFENVVLDTVGEQTITAYAFEANGNKPQYSLGSKSVEIELIDPNTVTKPTITTETGQTVVSGSDFTLSWNTVMHPTENVLYYIYVNSRSGGYVSVNSEGIDGTSYTISGSAFLAQVGSYSIDLYAVVPAEHSATGEMLQSEAATIVVYVELNPSPEPDQHEHSYSVTDYQEATCTAKGWEKKSCSCGDEITTELPKSSHKFASGKCSVCGEKAPNYDPDAGDPSEGLKFNLNSDKISYTVSKGDFNGTKLVIPAEYEDLPVTRIAYKAFYNMSNLVSVVIPENVTVIEYGAFQNCSKLEEITIPSTLENITGYSVSWDSYYAFRNCENLKRVYISDIEAWCNINFNNDAHSNPLCYGADLYLNGSKLENLVIPSGIVQINPYTFYNCDSIKSVRMSDDVILIGKSAFSQCNFIKTLILNEELMTIGEGAFNDCTSLETLSLPDELVTMGAYAFSGCSSLRTITFSEELVYIGESAFSDCVSLKSVTLPNSVVTVGTGAFRYCSALTKFVFSDELGYVPGKVLKGCKSLTSVVIPNGVTKIGSRAFDGCNSLMSVEIPGSVTSIDTYAFNNCTSLTSIEIPDSVTCIGEYVFCGCTSLMSVEIPDSVTSIGGHAFYGCTILKSVEIPDSVANIGEYAFCNCTVLTSVEIPDSVANIGDYAFSGCTSLKSVVIPNSVKNIGAYAFSNCTVLKSVAIPDSVAYIGAYVFDSCTSLMSVEFGDGVTNITSCAFNGCTSLTSIVIPDSVTNIGDYAFRSCTSLTSIVIPDSVTTIGSYAFQSCTSLTSIVIPDSVTNIGYRAFYSCTSLTSIVIADSVTNIDSDAFFGCTSLKTITYKGTKDEWEKISKGSSWFANTLVTVIHCTDGDVEP